MGGNLAVPNRFDWLLYGTLIFILTYDLPPVWTSVRFSPIDNAVVQNPVSYHIYVVLLLIGTLFYALASVGFDLRIFGDCMRKEPLLWLLVLWIALSSLWAPELVATIKGSFDLIVMAMIAAVLVHRFSVAHIVAFGAAAYAVGTVLHGIFIVLLPNYGLSAGDWKGITAQKNGLGHYSVLACMLFFFAARFFPRFRVVNYFFLSVNVVLVLGTASKTSLVRLVALPAMLIVFQVFRARRTLYGAVALAFVGGSVTMIAVVGNNIGPIAIALGKDPRLSGRTQLWSASIDLIRKHPIFGNGFQSTFTDWFAPGRQVWQTVGFQLPNAHNAVLQAALDLGVVGAALLVALVIRVVVRGARVLRYVPGMVGMFPLVFAGEMVLYGITEAGIINRNVDFLFFCIMVLESTTGRRDLLKVNSSPRAAHQPNRQRKIPLSATPTFS